VAKEKSACLWRVDAPGGAEKSASLLTIGVQSAMYAPLLWKEEVLGVLYVDSSSAKATFDKDDLRLMQLMASQTAIFIKNLSLQQAIQREALLKARLLAQFPRPIAERLAHQDGRLAIVSERVDTATVLFSDVRGFVKLASQMEPENVVQMLNDMFHDLTPIILKHYGTVDKYVGDSMLAVFGSPDPDERQWEHAVQAALEMQAAVRHLASGRWKGRPAFQIGVGIHTGPVIHGFVGAPERMEYTVIGSTINTTSRYCDGASPGEILISPATYARVHHWVEVEHPPREIETKHEGQLKAYLVRGWRGKRKTRS
jgi:adenylate cyclase